MSPAAVGRGKAGPVIRMHRRTMMQAATVHNAATPRKAPARRQERSAAEDTTAWPANLMDQVAESACYRTMSGAGRGIAAHLQGSGYEAAVISSVLTHEDAGQVRWRVLAAALACARRGAHHAPRIWPPQLGLLCFCDFLHACSQKPMRQSAVSLDLATEVSESEMLGW